MQHYSLFFWFLMASWFFAGCAPVAVSEQPEAPMLGAIYNLSGVQAGLDIPSSHGARLAVRQVNQRGGVLGKQMKLIMTDGKSDLAVVRKRSAEMLDRFPNIAAMMGLSDSDMVLAAAPVAASRRRLFVTSGATSPKLPDEVPEYLFLACFGDNVQAAAGAEWAYQDRSARTVSVLFNGSNTYTRLLHHYFQIRFKQLGGTVAAVERYTPDNIRPAIERLKQADLIFLSAESAEEALKVIGLLRQAGFSSPILGGDGFDAVDPWSMHPQLSDIFFTTHAYLGKDNPDPEVVAFRQAYHQAWPENQPDAFTALGYDTVRLLIRAIEKAQSIEPDKVRQALAEIRHFQGVTGTMSYPPGSRIPVKSVTILEIDHGKRKLVRQLLPTEVPPP